MIRNEPTKRSDLVEAVKQASGIVNEALGPFVVSEVSPDPLASYRNTAFKVVLREIIDYEYDPNA